MTAQDAALVDALVARGVLRSEAEGLLQRADEWRKREMLAARILPHTMKPRSVSAVKWCEENGGHLDNGAMFVGSCETCGIDLG